MDLDHVCLSRKRIELFVTVGTLYPAVYGMFYGLD